MDVYKISDFKYNPDIIKKQLKQVSNMMLTKYSTISFNVAYPANSLVLEVLPNIILALLITTIVS